MEFKLKKREVEINNNSHKNSLISHISIREKLEAFPKSHDSSLENPNNFFLEEVENLRIVSSDISSDSSRLSLGKSQKCERKCFQLNHIFF